MATLIPHAIEQQKEFDDLLSKCENIKKELFALPSCRLTTGQLLTLGDLELFGLSSLKARRDFAEVGEATRLLNDFQNLRGEILQ